MTLPRAMTEHSQTTIVFIDGRETPAHEQELPARTLLPALERVITRLDAAGIPYCTLQNRDRLVAGLRSGANVVIFVPAGTSPALLIHALADLSPARIVEGRERIAFYIPAGQHFLHVDVFHRDPEWLGARYLTNREILHRSHDDEGISVAFPTHQALVTWLHSLLRHPSFDHPDVSVIARAVKLHGSEFRSLLDEALGTHMGNQLWHIAASGDVGKAVGLSRRIKRTVFLRGLRHQFRSTVAGCLDQLRMQLQIHVRPTGPTIAILGLDGAGKSTLVDFLCNQPPSSWPAPANINDHIYRSALPSLYQLRRGEVKPGSSGSVASTARRRQPPHNPIVSVLTLVYSLVDQWLSEMVWGRPQLAKGHIRFLDRHMIEIFADPTRYRYGGPSAIARLFMKLIPQPDLIFLLDASPETLRRRKGKAALDAKVQERKAYRDIIQAGPDRYVLNADRETTSLAAEVRRRVLDALEFEARQSIADAKARAESSMTDFGHGAGASRR